MSTLNRPPVVELIGLAGSGKTTLATELLSRDRDIALGAPLSRTRSAMAQASAVAPFVIPYLRDVRGTAWFSRHQTRDIGYLCVWRDCLSRVDTDAPAVIFDHGPLFRLARLKAFGPPVASTEPFRRWWRTSLDEWTDLIDLFVLLDAPDEILLRRIRSRLQGHAIRGAHDVAARHFLARYRSSIDQVLLPARRRSPRSVLELRTERDLPAALADKVQESICRTGRTVWPAEHARDRAGKERRPSGAAANKERM